MKLATDRIYQVESLINKPVVFPGF